jgi:hypothetical protein
MRASKLSEGLWSAQWNNWEILLDGRDGSWTAAVSLNPKQRAEGRTGFASSTDAAAWATQQLQAAGQKVFLLSNDGAPKTLVDMLCFQPVTS